MATATDLGALRTALLVLTPVQQLAPVLLGRVAPDPWCRAASTSKRRPTEWPPCSATSSPQPTGLRGDGASRSGLDGPEATETTESWAAP